MKSVRVLHLIDESSGSATVSAALLSLVRGSLGEVGEVGEVGEDQEVVCVGGEALRSAAMAAGLRAMHVGVPGGAAWGSSWHLRPRLTPAMRRAALVHAWSPGAWRAAMRLWPDAASVLSLTQAPGLSHGRSELERALTMAQRCGRRWAVIAHVPGLERRLPRVVPMAPGLERPVVHGEAADARESLRRALMGPEHAGLTLVAPLDESHSRCHALRACTVVGMAADGIAIGHASVRLLLRPGQTDLLRARRQLEQLGQSRRLILSEIDPLRVADVVFSLAPGQGLSVATAMTAGLPVVAASVDGAGGGDGSGWIEHGVSGLVAASAQRSDLASALWAMLNDPSRRAGMGEAARERAAALFDLDAYRSRLAGVYERVLSGWAVAGAA